MVEYPLSELIQAALQDGRTHGVGLLVGRNIDRQAPPPRSCACLPTAALPHPTTTHGCSSLADPHDLAGFTPACPHRGASQAPLSYAGGDAGAPLYPHAPPPPPPLIWLLASQGRRGAAATRGAAAVRGRAPAARGAGVRPMDPGRAGTLCLLPPA